MTFLQYIRISLRSLSEIKTHVDTATAEQNIRGNVYFKGPNILILAFSIIIASVGLNVNSTAVVIGAMLISPLMGPIIGTGLSVSINDTHLLRDSLWNLLIMVVISLAASALYFMLSPLELANPTELEARTSPSIFDVLIALFGGAAGIVEMSRKDKGTVLSGVAIATALMPPLCTAGYGIAHGSGHFFFGALGLFSINAIFIALATYLGAKLLNFHEVEFIDEVRAKRTRSFISALVLVVVILSVWSAFRMVRANNFESNAEAFIRENRSMDKAYIYDYHIDSKARTLEVKVTGREMTQDMRSRLVSSAVEHGLPHKALIITENTLQGAEEFVRRDQVLSYMEHFEGEIARRDEAIRELSDKVDSLHLELLNLDGQMARQEGIVPENELRP